VIFGQRFGRQGIELSRGCVGLDLGISGRGIEFREPAAKLRQLRRRKMGNGVLNCLKLAHGYARRVCAILLLILYQAAGANSDLRSRDRREIIAGRKGNL
jgi:hypothetical protein